MGVGALFYGNVGALFYGSRRIILWECRCIILWAVEALFYADTSMSCFSYGARLGRCDDFLARPGRLQGRFWARLHPHPGGPGCSAVGGGTRTREYPGRELWMRVGAHLQRSGAFLARNIKYKVI